MLNPTTNHVISDFVSNLNFGMIRNVKCIKINKTPIAIRLTQILYMQGVLRTYKISNDSIIIYYKFNRSRHIITKLKVVSKFTCLLIFT